MGNRLDNMTAAERNELSIKLNPPKMSEEPETYNDLPIKVWSPVYQLPVTGYVLLRKGFIWRNKLFSSMDQGMLQLRFAYPNDLFELIETRVHRYRNGDYEFVEVNLVKSA